MMCMLLHKLSNYIKVLHNNRALLLESSNHYLSLSDSYFFVCGSITRLTITIYKVTHDYLDLVFIFRRHQRFEMYNALMADEPWAPNWRLPPYSQSKVPYPLIEAAEAQQERNSQKSRFHDKVSRQSICRH